MEKIYKRKYEEISNFFNRSSLLNTNYEKFNWIILRIKNIEDFWLSRLAWIIRYIIIIFTL